MVDYYFSLPIFNEHVILFRTMMYSFGWTTLFTSTVVLLYKAKQIRRKVDDFVLSKLIFPVLIGWLATMWSLGTVCTFYVYTTPKIGMIVTFPIFLIWCITMIVAFYITSRWIKEAIFQHNETNKLNQNLKVANTKLKELDKLKSEFITVATHQLRTPLTEIKWVLNMLSDKSYGKLSKDQDELVKRGSESNERVIKIINELLNSEQTGSINWGYNFQKSSMEKIVKEVIINLSLLAKRREVILRFEENKESLPKIDIDPMKINVALSVIIDNAINYSKKGREVIIKCENLGNAIQVSVIDEGIGIPVSEEKRIFSKFFRGQKATTIKPDGTGIGLSIAKNIIKVHGGSIWFGSNSGKGTSFYFRIPYKKQIL